MKGAYVHLLSHPSYLPGIIVLHKTHLDHHSKYPFVALVTPAIDDLARAILKLRGIIVKDVPRISPPAGFSLAAHDTRFEDTWTKLRAFEMIEYDRVVLRDIDMIVMKNMDDLFEINLPPGYIAATHACACNPLKLAHYPSDWIPSNCGYTPLTHPECLTHPTRINPSSPRPYNLLNSGIILLQPSLRTSSKILSFLSTSPLVASYKFPDQDLLADVFYGRWVPLPYIYNALKTLRVCHRNIWRDEDVRCLHYIMDKPWNAVRPEEGVDKGAFDEVSRWWWREADEMSERREEGWEVVESMLPSALGVVGKSGSGKGAKRRSSRAMRPAQRLISA